MALKAGRVGVNPEDVDFMTGHIKGVNYSAEDTIIGTWVDGKPLHRMVIEVDTPATSSATVVSTVINNNNADVKNISGFIYASASGKTPVNFYLNDSNKAATWVDNTGILVSTSYINKRSEIIVDYTKIEAITLSLEEE